MEVKPTNGKCRMLSLNWASVVSEEPQSPEPVVKGRRNKVQRRDFLGVKWVRLHASTAGGVGSIPSQGTKIPQAMQCGQKINNVTSKHKIRKVKV